MFFNFLRKYLIDREFENLKSELTETKQVLREYKEFLIQYQNKSDETEKVEPDFLNLMWVSVGFAIAVFISAGQKAVELQDKFGDLSLYVWVILALFSLYFIVKTGINPIKLTRKYIASKKDPAYKDYEWYLTTGAILLFLATLILAFLPKIP